MGVHQVEHGVGKVWRGERAWHAVRFLRRTHRRSAWWSNGQGWLIWWVDSPIPSEDFLLFLLPMGSHQKFWTVGMTY